MKTIPKLIALLILLGSASLSPGAVMLLNFGSEAITHWNSLGSFNNDLAAGSVIDSSGEVWAGLAITTNNFANSVSNSGTYASGGTVPSWMSNSAATTTWIRSGGTGPATVVISGLNDSLTYTLDLVSARNTGTSQLSNLSVNGLDADVGISVNYSAPAAWSSGEVLTWNSLTPVSGTITLSINGINSSNTAYLNALRLSADPVPEPSTYALLGLGILGLVLLRPFRSSRV